MKTITSSAMQVLERRAIEEFGIPALILMENAGRGIADIALRYFKTAKQPVVLAGKGNNGGDGFAAARHLHNLGCFVRVIHLCGADEMKGDALINYEIVRRMRIPLIEIKTEEDVHKIRAASLDADFLVDALFGTGLKSEIKGLYAASVKTMNDSGKSIISADIPSGLDADDGSVHGIAVKAAVTATMGVAKAGLFTGQGPEYSGKVVVVDIGMPKELLDAQ